MAAQILPVAGIALKYAGIAAAGYTLARMLPRKSPDPRAEAALDDLPEGLDASADDQAARGSFRIRRAVKFGRFGARLDAALLSRIKVTRFRDADFKDTHPWP